MGTWCGNVWVGWVGERLKPLLAAVGLLFPSARLIQSWPASYCWVYCSGTPLLWPTLSTPHLWTAQTGVWCEPQVGWSALPAGLPALPACPVGLGHPRGLAQLVCCCTRGPPEWPRLCCCPLLSPPPSLNPSSPPACLLACLQPASWMFLAAARRSQAGSQSRRPLAPSAAQQKKSAANDPLSVYRQAGGI